MKALKDSEATQKTLKAAADEAKSSLAKALKDSEAAQKQSAARLKQAEARIKELEVQLQAGTVRGGAAGGHCEAPLDPAWVPAWPCMGCCMGSYGLRHVHALPAMKNGGQLCYILVNQV